MEEKSSKSKGSNSLRNPKKEEVGSEEETLKRSNRNFSQAKNDSSSSSRLVDTSSPQTIKEDADQFFSPSFPRDEAAFHLEEELATIRDRFEHGEMQAFGSQQEKLLKDLKEIRQRQATLSMKQVAALGDLM